MSTDNKHMELTDEERCQHAGLNASGFSLGLLRYAREQGQRPEAADVMARHGWKNQRHSLRPQ